MLNLVRLWIVLSALFAGGGWILSALHALNPVGYSMLFVIAAVGLIFWWRKNCSPVCSNPGRSWSKFRRRFRRPAPLIFLLMCLINLAGGLLDRADNGDTNAYRIPRVLHWLAQQQWHWIHTGDSRMNIAGCNYEWWCAPFILFSRTDRWLFLINLLPYFLLPGLVFDALRRMGVAGRAAWWWMWVLAAGWCCVLQACSTLNDSLGVLYAVAAVAFALRARDTGKPGDLWLSLLAAAWLTGLKQTNLPLLLPWLVAMWPARHVWLKKPAMSCLVVMLALLISAVTQSYLNWKYAGTWSGFPKNAQDFSWGRQQELTSPFWGLIGNLFCFPLQNLLPIFFPWAGAWNNAMLHFVQTPFGSHFAQFEVFGRLSRSVTAANAGIGLAAIGLALISLLAAFCLPRPAPGAATKNVLYFRLLQLVPWISLLVFLAKVGTYQNARQAAPYYVLLFPLLLAGARQATLVRRRWWQFSAIAALCLTLAFLGFVHGREVLPPAVVAKLQEKYPHRKWLAVFADYYASRLSVESQRNFLQKNGVTDEKIVGYATTTGACEPGWWLPLGTRRIERVLPGDNASALRQKGIRYVAVEDITVIAAHETIEQWADRYHGEIVAEGAFTKDPNAPPGHLYLVRLRDPDV